MMASDDASFTIAISGAAGGEHERGASEVFAHESVEPTARSSPSAETPKPIPRLSLSGDYEKVRIYREWAFGRECGFS